MNGFAQATALVSAIASIGASTLEMFFFDRPWARRFLHVEHRDVDDVKMWAFCIGARNLIAGVGMLVGLWILRGGDAEVGRTVVLTTTWYMLLASLAMGVADLLGHWRPRGGSLFGTVASSLPPLLILIAATR
jgi:putative membrane protein